jgi:FlaA1/EpsC-like NDP-sugar epimerase/dTDP-4-amino-4,6-dideoxygalactose transaminase
MKINDAAQSNAIVSVSADSALPALAVQPSSSCVPLKSTPTRIKRSWLILGVEVLLTALSYVLAVTILYSGPQRSQLLWTVAFPLIIGFRFVGLYSAGLYRSSLRHASVHDLLSIVKAVAFSSALIFLFLNRLGSSTERLPFGVFVLDWALCQTLLVGIHFGTRIYQAQRLIWSKPLKRVAIVGAGDAGMSLARELASDPESPSRPVAIFDDNPQTHGTTICGVPVVGTTHQLTQAAQSKFVDEVLICIPSATRSEMSRILSICCQSGLPVRTLPTLSEIVDGKVSRRDLRNLQIEDLLQRKELLPDPAEVAEIAGDQVVLITGAGGSIGSELSRQVAAAQPKKLLLLEKTENSLFYIDRELHEHFPSLPVKALLADVTQRNRVNEIFAAERPSLVFHAAAHKHVGLLEQHPTEAIRNNVIGTRNVALAALHNGVSRFVNISTDKAVNPENYMGLSKKITELCTQHLAARNRTRFMNVRFGNVAGSTGSVLRLFWEQIQKGETLHVTDPRATRFFMSIPEAVHLILRAAGQGQGGETFVLEMGEPINIYELAKSMSLLAGFAPGTEVPIHFVGLREGEKVNEELWSEWERPVPTLQKGILAIAEQDPLASDILRAIDELEARLAGSDHKGLRACLADLFPSFAAKRKEFSSVEAPILINAVNTPQGATMQIPLSKPEVSELEIQSVTEVLRSNRLSLGPKLPEFEEKFAAYVGMRYAIATNSGSTALHLCIRSLGIGPQDEVITTPFSFVASTNCIMYEGAVPLFLDIDPVTLNIDPKQLRRFLRQCCGLDTRRGVLVNKQTGRVVKAILPVHVFGLPCDMDPILELARQYGLYVIEDACEALGAEYRGRNAGTFGDVAAFGFYPNKQMTTGEGGMIVTDSEEIAKLCRSMRNQGRDEDSSWLRHVRLGYNYRLNEMQCALGLAQLERLPELLDGRETVAGIYSRTLASVPHITLPAEFGGIKRSWFVYTIQLDLPTPRAMRDRILLKLRERGVECQAYFPAIHKQAYIAKSAKAPLGSLYRTEQASDRCITLPLFPSMTQEQIEYVCNTLTQILNEELRSSTLSTALSSRALVAASGVSQ